MFFSGVVDRALLADGFENLQNGFSQQRDVEFDHALLLVENVRADDAHQRQSSVMHDNGQIR